MASDIAVKVEKLTIGDWSTLKFFGVNILTFNIILYVWIWQVVNRIGSQEEQSTNRLFAIFIFIAVAWGPYISDILDEISIYGMPRGLFSIMAFASGIIFLSQYVISIVLSFRIKPILEKFYRKQGKALKLDSIFCFLFPFYYQYYKLYQLYSSRESEGADPLFEQLTLKLKKLEILKKQGAITQEQYEMVKDKILKKMYE